MQDNKDPTPADGYYTENDMNTNELADLSFLDDDEKK